MSQNIFQVYTNNPITTNASTDLMYFGQSPYGAGNDAAMTFVNFNAQIVANGTANQIGYYATSGNKISPITGANNGVLITNNTGVPSLLANSGTPGFVLTANTGVPPSWQAVSASGAITQINGDSGTATPSSGIITISGGGIGLTTSGSSNTLSLTGTLAIAHGGTSVTSVTTVPTATAFAGWDSHSNLSANGFIPSFTTTVASGSLITLTVNSTQIQQITGVSNQQIQLPAASTLALGQQYFISNFSDTGYITTVYDENSDVVAELNSTCTCIMTLISKSSVFWQASFFVPESSFDSNILLSGTAGALSWSTSTYPATNAINTLLYASSANVMSALAAGNNGVLVSSNTGVPSWLANSGTPGFVLTANSGAAPSWQSVSASGAITTINGDSGSVTPSSGAVTINGGSTGLTTSGSSHTLSLTGTLAIGHGGTGVTSVTTSPTASAFAGWDANSNLSANNHIPAYTTTATAAMTTTLTVSSTYYQYFTGTTTQTVIMPVANTLAQGQSWYFVNNSTGNVTVQSSGSNTIQVMAGKSSMLITCILNSGTTAASWNAQYFIDSDVSGAVLLAPTGTQTISTYGLVVPSVNFGGSTLSTYTSVAAWTPTFQFATLGDLSVSYSVQFGYYTKIGSLVNVSFYLTFVPTYTTSSGNAQIASLPVAGVGTVGFFGTWIAQGSVAMPAGSTQFYLSMSTAGGTAMNLGSQGSLSQTILSTTQFISGNTYTLLGSLSYLASS